MFHGLDVALLLLALVAGCAGAAVLKGLGDRLPVVPGHAVSACGVVATTVVLIFVDTAGARFGAFAGLAGALAMLAGGLLLGGRAGETTPAPPGWYPDPLGEARLRYWDGADWTGHTDE